MVTLYDPRTWVAGVTPLSAPNMNQIETGIRAVSPVGSVMMWPLEAPPAGWLALDGAEVSRATYPELWSFVDGNGLIATGMYGVGNGSTTFDLPDATGRFIRNPALGGDGGSTGGSESHSHIIIGTNPAGGHSHTVANTNNAGGHSHTNPSTSSTGDHGHGAPSSGSAQAQSAAQINVSTIAHLHSNTGAHSHTQGPTSVTTNHAHSVGDTDTESNHSHGNSDSAFADTKPSFLEMWFIVAT